MEGRKERSHAIETLSLLINSGRQQVGDLREFLMTAAHSELNRNVTVLSREAFYRFAFSLDASSLSARDRSVPSSLANEVV